MIGHLIGYVLISIALAHSRAIPLWAAILIIVGILFQMAGYGANLPVLPAGTRLVYGTLITANAETFDQIS